MIQVLALLAHADVNMATRLRVYQLAALRTPIIQRRRIGPRHGTVRPRLLEARWRIQGFQQGPELIALLIRLNSGLNTGRSTPVTMSFKPVWVGRGPFLDPRPGSNQLLSCYWA